MSILVTVTNSTAHMSEWAIASLICGVAALALWFTSAWGGLLALVAIICGLAARGDIAKGNAAGGKGLALAGIILGVLALVMRFTAGG